MTLRASAILASVFLATAGASPAVTYEVGPGKPLAAISEVPWESLQPGDTVLIHARAEPYREKFVICRAGMADAPITVRGVPGPDRQLPVINGNGATTRTNLNYWGDARSVIKIGGAQVPADTLPQFIVFENLDIRGARPPHMFTGADGVQRRYAKNAAAVHVEKAEHLILRNCRLHDCGNGLFVSSNNERASRDILVEGCAIYDNGNPGSGFEHNVYTEAIGMVYQFNHFGPLRTNCIGNNIKDRSAGLIIRYNWIEGGNKELDLVDAQDSAIVRNDPRYHEAFVYGNVLLKLPRDVHSFLVHYGNDGDRPSRSSRNGTLHFYHNTVVSYRAGTTTLFRLSSDGEHCDFRNNLVYAVPPKAKIVVLESKGSLDLSHNWFNTGWKGASTQNSAEFVRDDKTSLASGFPGFVDLAQRDFRLTAGSPCRDAGVPLPRMVVDRQYVKHQSGKIRIDDGKPDIGAFEFGN